MSILDDQIAYYRARAPEYDDWFWRRGRYDRGQQHRDAWSAEIEVIRSALGLLTRDCDVLELACGTGLWTHLISQTSRSVVAVDASPEAISINRHRAESTNVEFVVADLFSWTPLQRFDLVFFSFWLSHVPPEHFTSFWNMVRTAVKPHGHVFFADSLLEQSSTAVDHDPVDSTGIVNRKLNDGREFQIVKVFYRPDELELRLRALGWSGWVRATETFFLYGALTPS